MPPALLFRTTAFGALVARAVQARLHTLDVPPDGERHLDHVDIAADTVDLDADGAGVRFVVPLDVYVVTRPAAVAAVDDVPAGARVPAAPVDLHCSLALDGGRLLLRARRPVAGPGLPAAWCEALAAAIGPWTLDLRPPLAALGHTPTPDDRVTCDDRLVALRFGGRGEALAPLPAAFDWGWCGVTVPAGTPLPGALAGATPGGSCVGGPLVLPPAPDRAAVAAGVDRFGPPTRVTTCRALGRPARPGPRAVTLDELSTRAEVRLDGAGRLLAVEALGAPFDLGPHLRRLPDERGLVVLVPSSLSLSFTGPVRLLLRTSRGLRAVDLGAPPHPEFDAAGRVTNAATRHVTNCGRPDGAHGLHWRFDGVRADLPSPPPRDGRDWTGWLAGLDALDVQLVMFDGLEPGELVHFRSRDHAAHVTADRHGRARVPVVMPVAGHGAEGRLVRTNRRPIAGRYIVRGVTFHDTSPQRHRGVAWLNPQPLPPVAAPGAVRHPLLAGGVALPGLVSLEAVPGFDDAPIALARMADDTVLVVEADDAGTVRVAGTFEGPIGPLDTGRYRVTRA